jgi:hypothetical protein
MRLSRRELMAAAVASAGGARAAGGDVKVPRPRVAAIVTEYRENSHADVIVGKFLEGCKVLDTDFRPQVEVASLYLDQVPANDTGREAAARHRVPIHASIEAALTLRTGRLAVDGILLIGEHGQYPYNEIGQHLYPRRRFFEAAAEVMRRSKRSVPVFNDKHLACAWSDAKWMADTARELKIPFMAGSSLPVTWRKPEVEIPRGAALTGALAVGYGGAEAYGFHALETLQCMVERRKRGETGVRSVRCVSGEALWRSAKEGFWSWELLQAALRRSEKPEVARAGRAEVQTRCQDPEAFLIEYRDGLRAAVLMLYGLADEFLFAGSVRGEREPLSTLFWLQEGKPFGHFARLSDAIQRMFLTGRPTYPVERTLLTTGILDAAMHSRAAKGALRDTPELDVRY